MSLDDSLPSHWQYYSGRAREAHCGHTDDFGQGREEQLHETLKFIAWVTSGNRVTKEIIGSSWITVH